MSAYVVYGLWILQREKEHFSRQWIMAFMWMWIGFILIELKFCFNGRITIKDLFSRDFFLSKVMEKFFFCGKKSINVISKFFHKILIRRQMLHG